MRLYNITGNGIEFGFTGVSSEGSFVLYKGPVVASEQAVYSGYLYQYDYSTQLMADIEDIVVDHFVDFSLADSCQNMNIYDSATLHYAMTLHNYNFFTIKLSPDVEDDEIITFAVSKNRNDYFNSDLDSPFFSYNSSDLEIIEKGEVPPFIFEYLSPAGGNLYIYEDDVYTQNFAIPANDITKEYYYSIWKNIALTAKNKVRYRVVINGNEYNFEWKIVCAEKTLYYRNLSGTISQLPLSSWSENIEVTKNYVDNKNFLNEVQSTFNATTAFFADKNNSKIKDVISSLEFYEPYGDVQYTLDTSSVRVNEYAKNGLVNYNFTFKEAKKQVVR